MNLVGRQIGMTTRDGLSVVQLWARCGDTEELCIGTTHLSKNITKDQSIFEIDSILLSSNYFRRVKCPSNDLDRLKILTVVWDDIISTF